jgi:hypothetical protein
MKWAAVLGNFFFMGLGYVIAVPEKRVVGIMWTIAAVILTYVEQFAINQETNFRAFSAMFVGVLIANTAFAIDGWREYKKIEAAQG